MGNPQPRGFRQAPLIPSGFFLCWTWLTNLREGRRRCPTRKSRSLSGNSETGGFHDHTHNEGLWVAHREFTRYSRTGGFLDHSHNEARGAIGIPWRVLPGTLEPEGFSSTPTTE